MPTFEGCKQAKEISLTRKGANQHAHVLIRKSAATPAANEPLENTPMTEITAADVQKAALAITNKVMRMDDTTKSFYFGLNETAQIAFLEKSAEDQKSEADAAKAEADRKAAEAEAAKTGQTVRELELQKRLDDQAKEIEALKAKRVDDEIEKRAATEFAGYPGGVEVVVPLLKGYATLPENLRIASEAVLKSQCKTAMELTRAFGGRTETDVSKAQQAAERIEKRAKELATEKKISFQDAYIEVTEMREFADDVAAL